VSVTRFDCWQNLSLTTVLSWPVWIRPFSPNLVLHTMSILPTATWVGCTIQSKAIIIMCWFMHVDSFPNRSWEWGETSGIQDTHHHSDSYLAWDLYVMQWVEWGDLEEVLPCVPRNQKSLLPKHWYVRAREKKQQPLQPGLWQVLESSPGDQYSSVKFFLCWIMMLWCSLISQDFCFFLHPFSAGTMNSYSIFSCKVFYQDFPPPPSFLACCPLMWYWVVLSSHYLHSTKLQCFT